MAAPVLQFKRGVLANLPALRAGEPGFTTNSYDLYVGIDSTSPNNQLVGSGRFWSAGGATTGSGVNLVEATDNGTNFITLASPASLAGIVTYYFPGTQGFVSSVLTNDGSGNLSWASGSADPVFTGIATFNTTLVDINSDINISGVTTVSNTEDNTLGDVNTGSFQLDGGLGVAKNVTVGGNLNVQGYSEFVGVATFKGGTINLGDSDTDDINVAGEFISSLVPNDDNSYDVGGDASKQWRHANFAGIGTFDGGLDIGGEASLASATVEDLTSGRVVLAGTGGALEDSGNLTFNGSLLTVTGDATVTDSISVTKDASVGSALTVTGAIDGNGGADISGGETTLSSATVSDLTSGRVVLAGTSGALEDSGNLTFNGSLLTVTGDITVTDSIAVTKDAVVSAGLTVTGAVDFNGGLNVSGAESILSSATVSDLTSGRVVLAGTSGALEDSGNLTFNGSLLTVTGDVTVTDSIAVTKDAVVSAGLTVTGAVDFNGGANISGGETTLSSATVSDLTSGRVVLAGTSGAIEDSGNLTFNGTTLTVTGDAAIDNVTINGNTVSTSSGGLTLDSTSGTTTVADDLTVNGTLTVLGTQSIINTETLKVEDSLIEVGLVNSGGSLVPPSSDANIDVGVVLHYYSGSAKTAAMFWDDSAGRIVVASEVTETTSVMGSITYANLEIGALTVTDCQGVSQSVITCSGSTRTLENITVDGGSF